MNVLFQISTAELLACNVDDHILTVSHKNWAAYWTDNQRRVFTLVNHNLAKVCENEKIISMSSFSSSIIEWLWLCEMTPAYVTIWR
jgi:hypothetical protein